MGHRVMFGSRGEDNHVENHRSGETMMLRRKKSGHVFDVEFLLNEVEAKAEESVGRRV
jgi:hypothetical protein